jgi:HPt (histidine-containing phosphotransfer) domain-containing protein
MDEYLSKPIRPEELALVLERLLPVHPDDDHTLEHSMALDSDIPGSRLRANPVKDDDTSISAIEAPSWEDENSQPINRALFQEWQELGGSEFVTRMAEQFVTDVTNCVRARMAEQFVTDVTNCVRAIEQALDQKDSHGLAEAAHGLKGICANVGATQLHHMAISIEQANREGKTLDGPQTMEMLQTAVAHIRTFLATVQSPHR